jgi:hypothetical protein
LLPSMFFVVCSAVRPSICVLQLRDVRYGCNISPIIEIALARMKSAEADNPVETTMFCTCHLRLATQSLFTSSTTPLR